MNRSQYLLVGLFALVVVAGSASVAVAEELPLADAGLDQSVQQNTTVYLDAGGSVAPDGELVDYQWTIERPDGTTTQPDCPTCEETSFRATDVGVYNVTITVTDDSGRKASDTLRVTVAEHTPPDVTLTGPDTVTVDGEATISMNATAGDESLSSLVWLVDGQQYNATFLDGTTANRSITLPADETGETLVKARVTDRAGGHAVDRHTVRIENRQDRSRNRQDENNNDKPGDNGDSNSIKNKFTGSYSGIEGQIRATWHVYEGDTFRVEGISFVVYDTSHPNNKVIEKYPFTQSRAEIITSSGGTAISDPHDWEVWDPTPGLDVVSRTDSSMTVKAVSPQDATGISVHLEGYDGFGYHGYGGIEIREEKDEDPTKPEYGRR